MPGWLQAGLWGSLAGSALLLGAAIGYWARLPTRLIAGVMAFGAGVLISALSFDLMDEAFQRGGIRSAAIGFIFGAVAYSAANVALAKFGARHRKRSGAHPGKKQPSESEQSGSGLAIAVGALLDGVPESIVIGVSLLSGEGVSMVAVVAVFLSNVPEGLSSAAGMKSAGRGTGYIFGVWAAIALASGLASLFGFVGFQHASAEMVSGTMTVAAGAILAMLSDTMIPEASEGTHNWTGLITVSGFLCAFVLSKAL